VRRAIAGADLGQLHESVRREFLTLNDQERDVRAAVGRMEGSFMRHLEELNRER
jgi:F-type H+-transporting ATPase subunit epsilon